MASFSHSQPAEASGVSARRSPLALSNNTESVETRLARYKGIGPGFDFLRFALAALIFLGHAKWVAGGQGLLGGGDHAVTAENLMNADYHWSGTGRFKLVLVPMFFSLSGFLIMGSAARLRSPTIFVGHRLLRILPALLVEVTLSALVLGPALTSFGSTAYFGDPLLPRYFGNCIGWISFRLPGLFLSNPVPHTVNENLWTLPSEFDCYALTLALMLTGLLYSRTWFSWIFLAVTLGLAIVDAFTGISHPHGPYPPHVLTYYFFCGVFLFHWKALLPARIWVGLVCAGLTVASIPFDLLTYVTPLFLTATVVYIGLIPGIRVPFLLGGDYSYGIYLYGFPICQALIDVFPGLIGHGILVILLGGAATTIFAVASWHLIEKRVLSLRRYLPGARVKKAVPFESKSPA